MENNSYEVTVKFMEIEKNIFLFEKSGFRDVKIKDNVDF